MVTFNTTDFLLFYLIIAIALLTIAIFGYLGTRHIPDLPSGHKRKGVLS